MSSTPDGDPLDLQITEGWNDEPNSDWSVVFSQGNTHNFSDSESFDGDGSSLRVDDCSQNEFLAQYDASVSEPSPQFKIITQQVTFSPNQGDSCDLSFYIHIQDSNNFIVFSWNGRNEVQLNEKNSGSWNTVDENTSVGYQTATGGVWEQVTFDAWYESGVLLTRLQDPNGNTVGDTLTYSNPSWNDGAIGVGASYENSGRGCNGHLFIDATQVHYINAIQTPTAPQNLTASSVSSSQIDLDWDPPNSWEGEEGHYNILRGTSSGNLSEIDSVGSGQTTYSDTGLSEGTTFFYAIEAQNSAGTSPQSNEDSATTHTILQASGTGQGSGTAQLSAAFSLSADGAGTGTGTATLTRVREFTGTGQGVGTGTAVITRSKELSASGSGVGTGQGTLIKSVQLVASGEGIGTGEALLQAVSVMRASGDGVGTGTANITRSRSIEAHGSGVGTGTAILSAVFSLSADGEGIGEGTAVLLGTTLLSGTVELEGSGVEGAEVIIFNDSDDVLEGVETTDVNGDYSIRVDLEDVYHAAVQYEDDQGNQYNDESKPFIVH